MPRLFQKLVYTRQFNTANTPSLVVPTLLTDLELSIQVAPIKLPKSWKRAGYLHRFVGNTIDKTFLESWRLGFNKQVIRLASINMPYQLVFEPADWLGLTNLSIWRFSMPLYNDGAANSSAGNSVSTPVAASLASVVLLAANPNRKGFAIHNNSTATLYLGLAETPTSGDFAAKILPNGYYEPPLNFVGAVNGIWTAANGNAQVTEFS